MSKLTDTFTGIGVVTIIVLLIILIGVGPLLTIAALNTLFNLSIAYSFWTWLAMLWVQFLMLTKVSKS